MSRERGPEGAL